jgi:hypothetical protein
MKMRKLLAIGVMAMAAAGCADGPGPKRSDSSSTEGTTTVRVGVVDAVLPPAAPGAAPRLLLRYDDGGSATISTPQARDFLAGDRVRVVTRRNAIDIERFGP